ncbi:MAG: DinB family protein [Anaerolineae bacterium]|nr:DinB family protein [Anaerolineae bacterium]
MDAEQRKDLIEQYRRGYDELAACLNDIPAEMWQFKPEPHEWSVHEIIVHLADSESNSALRARLLIAEPGGALMVYDQDLWAKALDYHSQDWQDALQILKYARKSTYALIKDLPDEIWVHTARHPEYDEPYHFEMWLKIYAGHIPGHIKQIQNNHKLWLESQEV